MPTPLKVISPDLIAVGERLRLARENAEMTQDQAARLIFEDKYDIGKQAFVSKLELGQRIPRLKIVLKMAEVYGVSAADLLVTNLEPNPELPIHVTRVLHGVESAYRKGVPDGVFSALALLLAQLPATPR